jgi:diaminohydroxyphosphoribosylaminopyrimidine deaminase/5-amino-6-(5-phosphoribosylamino)uracil reductase
MHDEDIMRRALVLAVKAKGNTSPNPMVGAVIAAPDGSTVSEGFHERAGAPHAEAAALERAGERARGSTLFVTLEPCNHEGRTPPCTDAIIQAGVSRVVVASEDDDERVNGSGIRRLREAGIRVDVGTHAAEARHLNRMYFQHRRTGRPFVTLKMAQSIDGAIGARSGERRQLTGRKAAAYVRSLRYEHDAVMVGIGTVLVDDPALTVRPFKARAIPFARIVVDSLARLPPDSNLVRDQKRASTIAAVTGAAPPERVASLQSAGVDVIECASASDGRVDLRDLLDRLGERGMLGLLCEGGPALAGALLNANLAQELQYIVAPIVLGTAHAAPSIAGLTAPRELLVDDIRRMGDDTLIAGRPAEEGAN